MTYLVDVNLPKFFSYFHSPAFLFVQDLQAELPDSEIWSLALEKNYTILSQDTDFYHRAMQSVVFPKMVIFRLGNYRLAQLHAYFQKNWPAIQDAVADNQLLLAWPDKLEIIF